MTRHVRLYGHLRGPVTLASVAERLAVDLPLPVFTTLVYRRWIRTPNLLHGSQRSKRLLQRRCQSSYRINNQLNGKYIMEGFVLFSNIFKNGSL